MMFFSKAWRQDQPKRVYAIGDVHGRLDLFKRMIGTIKRDNAMRVPVATRIVMLGDLVDHGPDSALLVHYCRQLTESTDRFVVLKGDHEGMMVEALREGSISAVERWLDHGGKATLASWGVPESAILDSDPTALLSAARSAIGDDVLAWMDRLPLTSRLGGHLFVHAGIRPGVPLKRQAERDLLEIRGEFLRSKADHGVVVVHGHSVYESGPDLQRNRIGIDSGAYRTGRLTAIGVEDGQVWSLMTEPDRTDRDRARTRSELDDLISGFRIVK